LVRAAHRHRLTSRHADPRGEPFQRGRRHDIVYGQAGAKSLAASDPNGAINNADNHEYFAENTPSLN
jgi:hypothetical protein